MTHVAVPVNPAQSFYYPWSHQPKRHRRGLPLNNYPSLESDPLSIVFRLSDTRCLIRFGSTRCCWMAMPTFFLDQTPFLSKGDGCCQCSNRPLRSSVGDCLLRITKSDQWLKPGESATYQDVQGRNNALSNFCFPNFSFSHVNFVGNLFLWLFEIHYSKCFYKCSK